MNIIAVGQGIKIELNNSNLCISKFSMFKKNYSIGVHSFKIKKYKNAGNFKSGRLSFEVWKGYKKINYTLYYSKEEQKNFDELVKILKYGLPQEGLIHTAMGINGLIELYQNKIVIKRDSNSSDFYIHGLKGTKELWLKSITAIELKLPGTVTRGFLTRGTEVNGFIQFTVPGGVESKKGVISAISDENSVLFYPNQTNDFTKLKDLIENRLVDLEYADNKKLKQSNINLSNENVIETNSHIKDSATLFNNKLEKNESIALLENLARLKDLGILTEEEFNEKKRQILKTL